MSKPSLKFVPALLLASTLVAQSAPQPNVMLRFAEFDPAQSEPSIPPSLMAAADSRLFLVQFKSLITEQNRAELRSVGAEVHTFIPDQSYLIRMDPAALSQLHSLESVRWVSPFHVAFKAEPEILSDMLAGAGQTGRYNIVLVDPKRDAADVEGEIAAIGGRVDAAADGGLLIEATLSPSQLETILQHNGVQWVDRWGAIEVDMNNARIQAGVNTVEAVAGIDGKGMRAHIFEGIHRTHPEFGARPPYRVAPIWYRSSSASSHGTNTAGQVFAQGLNANYKGGMPFAQALYTPSGGSRYTLTRDLTDPNQQYKVMLQTASWGSPRTTTYTSVSADADKCIFDFDLFVTQSQSNSGGTPSRPQAWAKNITSVGGFSHRNNSIASDDCWCNTGSTGPAADGRIGVTLAGYYDSINTTNGSTGYTTSFGGTSGATPLCNGLSGLIIQMHTDGYFGYPATPSHDVRYQYVPHFTTSKALIVSGTRQLSFTGTRKANRFQQGWGFPSVGDVYDNRDRMLVIDELDVLKQGESRSYFVFVRPGESEFRAVMTYADPAAAPNATVHRINSLDLRVNAPGNVGYWGNGGLIAGPWSTPGGEPNDRDTEECVFLQNPASGVYEVNVRAAAVRQDGHVETGDVDADYALVVRGVAGGRNKQGMTLDLISNSSGQFDVALSNVPAGGWTAGMTLMSLDTARHAALGNLFGLEWDSLTMAIMPMAPSAGNVFSFSNSANPSDYPNAAFSFPAPIAAVLMGQEIDGVAFVYDASGNIVDVSNVDRELIQ